MAIKPIQLRGISRTPSDRMTKDGGLAESLNLYIDEDETAPMLPPEDVTETALDANGGRLFPDSTIEGNPSSWEAVYIHKSPYFTRAIVKYEYEGQTKLGWVNDGAVVGLLTLTDEETFVRGISIGNTLAIVTDKAVHWFLNKNGKYHAIAGSNLFPRFTVAAVDQPDVVHYWQGDNYGAPEYNDQSGLVSGLDDLGCYVNPTFFVMALTMYDGSKILSTPQLLGAGQKLRYRVSSYTSGGDHAPEITHWYILYSYLYAYKIWFRINEEKTFFDSLKEIVNKIDIYVSSKIEQQYDFSVVKGRQGVLSGEIEEDEFYEIPLQDNDSMLQEILLKSQFFHVKSYFPNSDNIQETVEFESLFGGAILDTSDIMSNDDLVVKESLDFSKADMKHYGTVFRNAIAFNDKLITSGISEEVRLSYPGLTATEYVDSDGAPQSQDKINGIGRWFAISASLNGDFSEEVWSQSVVIDGETKYPRPYAFIICPDVRAKYADISVHKKIDSTELDTVIRVEMKEHPFLDCSYWYGDISREIVDFETDADTMNRYPIQKNHQVSINGTTIDLYSYQRGGRSYTDVIPNKIYESEEANPFVFPLDGRHTFTGKVLGVAVATTALSTGQFGQFPLYVFTDDGIWALETGNDGSFVTSKPVSRDVCINPDSITTIDNAVVFVTEKGVMMISGSQVANLSENMNGKHFHLEEESGEYNLISGSDWSGLLPSISDDTHFMAFMREAFIVYDYTGNRLVFFKPDEVYQYVYYIKTATWHKMSFLSGRYAYPLSDYPDMFVNVKTDESGSEQTRILEISSKKDVMSENNIPGILITRPMEFDLADVRKVIKDIRIRGGYERGHVKYILLGSFDGINWTVLRSLRGGSYKLFRMIVLTNLSVNERISWIDVDFDSRYNNKMR